MRRLFIAAALAAVVAAPGVASAAPPAAPAPSASAAPPAALPVQFHPEWRAERGWEHRGSDEHRWHRREMRRAWDEQRIAEAARREARRIDLEREHRRAWRHAQRERHFWHHNGF